jgi:hypothetical protein
MAKLTALNGWQLLVFLLALATAAGLGVWALVWVAWTIRPLLAVAAAVAAVTAVLYARRRHRLSVDWHANEWTGS